VAELRDYTEVIAWWTLGWLLSGGSSTPVWGYTRDARRNHHSYWPMLLLVGWKITSDFVIGRDWIKTAKSILMVPLDSIISSWQERAYIYPRMEIFPLDDISDYIILQSRCLHAMDEVPLLWTGQKETQVEKTVRFGQSRVIRPTSS